MKRFAAVLIIVAVILFWQSSSASVASVPNLFAFQSLVYDGGGNPLPDGGAGVRFRVSDASGVVLYEERQQVEIVRGVLTAFVGEGADASGAPTAGLPFNLFDGSARFLEVEVEGYPPLPAMEMGSVPYAMLANEAARVAAGGVDSSAIADGSISIDDVSDAFVASLAQRLEEGGTIATKAMLDEAYSAPTAASRIGVEKRFNYSGSTNLQDVISDLDLAIRQREERITSEEVNRAAAINAEATARKEAVADEVSQRVAAVNAEANTRSQADDAEAKVRGDAISLEVSTRASADTALQNSLTQESASRTSGDVNLQSNINVEVQARESADLSIQESLAQERAERTYDLGQLTQTVEHGLYENTAPSTIWFAAGNVPDYSGAGINNYYSNDECEVLVSPSLIAGDNIYSVYSPNMPAGKSIGSVCARHHWTGSQSFIITCKVSTRSEIDPCDEQYADEVYACRANYLVICTHGQRYFPGDPYK